jgi:hypothetical protein
MAAVELEKAEEKKVKEFDPMAQFAKLTSSWSGSTYPCKAMCPPGQDHGSAERLACPIAGRSPALRPVTEHNEYHVMYPRSPSSGSGTTHQSFPDIPVNIDIFMNRVPLPFLARQLYSLCYIETIHSHSV